MGTEKQISVDPLSLMQMVKAGAAAADLMMHLPSLPPLALPKFVSCSLPGSALSSPKFHKSSKKWSNLARQHSAALSRFAIEQRMSLRRSKSCGEGRSSAPSDDLIDILSTRSSTEHSGNEDCVVHEPRDENSSFDDPGELRRRQGEESVKCGCLFLPGLSHKKKQAIDKVRMSTVPRAVSLEKFDCGSWTSSSPPGLGGDVDDGVQSCFDLPLELIRSGHNDTDSPVSAAFVFDRNRKGVLKKSSSRFGSSKSQGSSSNRHVRFSTSAPISYPASPSSTCITPRLQKAREEFNALLDAQSA
ncbi:hypothetical protein MUK42_27951 [Musa troglodytarum]|uniref:Uncharacterized protein n=1 Tax=Musa troglodytarum TaxID=320322 RepID=A0A9E7F6P1_9LILI|nr:hypothetical protein MUK42_27951 [Musa troglodytarum]